MSDFADNVLKSSSARFTQFGRSMTGEDVFQLLSGVNYEAAQKFSKADCDYLASKVLLADGGFK